MLPNGKVLLAGGCIDSKTSDIFDPATNAFSAGPVLIDPVSQTTPVGRKQFTLVLTVNPATNQTVALMAGGRAINGTSPADNDTFATQTTFAATWDLNSAAFTALSTLSGTIHPRALHTSTVIGGGKVLLAGGESETTATITVLNTADIIDPFAPSTTGVSNNMGGARVQHAAVKLTSGDVMFFGGSASGTGTADGSRGGLGTVEFFDAGTNQFDTSTTRGTITARWGLTANLLYTGGILLVGGRSSGTTTTATEVYDPTLGTSPVGGVLTGIAPLTIARVGHSATTLLSGKVAIAGGNGGNGTAVSEIFDIEPP
jgi:hypothetical protein